MSTFARFAPLLRRERFRLTYSSRSNGGFREWKRDEPDGRTLVVQLWASGEHRIAHEWEGCMDTPPTSFSDESNVFDAIERERTRADSTYRDPAAHHYEPARKSIASKQAALSTKEQA